MRARAGEPEARSALPSPFTSLGSIIQSSVKMHFPSLKSGAQQSCCGMKCFQGSGSTHRPSESQEDTQGTLQVETLVLQTLTLFPIPG